MIIDYLRGEKVDGKTLSFANKIFDELSEEIENRKLPIQICPGSDLLVAIDTLLETHKGVYTIKGSFDEYLGARIEVRNIFYDDAVKKFLDQLSLPLLMQDSLLQALKSNILKTKIFKIESYDKNELMSEYQFRFGVPTEINFFIYSTIGDLIVNDIVRTNVIDSNNIVSNEALLNYGLSVLKLAEYYIPTKVSLWGSKRTPRDLPAAYRIYSNIANVYNYKSRLETRKKDYRNSSLNGEISNIPAIDNIRKSDYYLNKLPRHYRSNAKEVEEGLRYYISFFDNQLTKGALELDIISRKSDALLMETNNLLNNSQKPFTVPGFFDYPKSSISLPTNEQAIRWLKTSREILKRIRRLKKDFLKAKYKLAIYVYYVKNIESQNNEVQSLLAIANNFLTVYEPMNKKYEETIQKAEAMEQGMDKIADLSKKRN